MAEDLLDAIRDQLANFAVGLVKRVEGAGSKIIGSGVLASVEGRRGILTCGHVAEQYNELCQIGLVRLIAGARQISRADIADAQTIIVQSHDTGSEKQGSDKWTEGGFDLAFTYLNHDVADSIAAQSVFLNVEKNRERIERGQPANSHAVDVVFGLVDEYSGKPFIENDRFISPMQGVIYRGKMQSGEFGVLQFQTIDEDPEKIPKNFGGLSGSGLWRIHFVEHDAGKFEIIEKRLWGIASWQIDKKNNKGGVVGQGWDRLDEGLIPAVRKSLQF
jgi:hypothetical protein